MGEVQWEGKGRKSKNKKVNRGGKLFVGRLEEIGWKIFNGGYDRERGRELELYV